jgi:hypothetical protein
MSMDIRTQGAHVEDWRATIVTAIEATPPPNEIWMVTAVEVADRVVRLDFVKDSDSPRAITVGLTGDRVGRALLYRMSCYLLRKQWPGALEVH